MTLYDPERRWAARAICRWEDRHLFFADGRQRPGRVSQPIQKAWAQAKEICGMCPVLLECQRDTLGENHGVWGGRDENERAAIRRKLHSAAKKWPLARRLRWGKEVQRLRDGGLSWRDITLQTGLPTRLAEEVSTQWRESVAASENASAIIDLPLPEDTARGPEFPTKPGRRHAWVRHNSRMSDAIYRGQTPSGRWVFVTVYSGHGHVNKWVPRNDVHLYNPQPVIIMSKRTEEADEAPGAHEPQRKRAA